MRTPSWSGKKKSKKKKLESEKSKKESNKKFKKKKREKKRKKIKKSKGKIKKEKGKNEKNEGPCIGVEGFLDKIGVLGLGPIPASQKCAKRGSCRHLILSGTSWIKCA